MEYIMNQLLYNFDISESYVLSCAMIRGRGLQWNNCPLINTSGDCTRKGRQLNFIVEELGRQQEILLEANLPASLVDIIHEFLYLGSFGRFCCVYDRLTKKMAKRRFQLNRKLVFKRVVNHCCWMCIGKILSHIINNPIVERPTKYNLDELDPAPALETALWIRDLLERL